MVANVVGGTLPHRPRPVRQALHARRAEAGSDVRGPSAAHIAPDDSFVNGTPDLPDHWKAPFGAARDEAVPPLLTQDQAMSQAIPNRSGVPLNGPLLDEPTGSARLRESGEIATLDPLAVPQRTART